MNKKDSWNPIRKGAYDSVIINGVSEVAELFYYRLLQQSDDNGNYEGDPFLILCGLYAKRAKKKQVNVTKVLQRRTELVTAGLIKLYNSGDNTYLHLVDCKKHLRKDIKLDIRFPEFTQTLVNKEVPVSVTNAVRKRNENVPSYTDTDTTTDSDTDTTKEDFFPTNLRSEEFQSTWKDWQQHRKEKRNVLTPTAIKRQIKFLSENPIQAVAILEQSMRNSYAGLFPIKGDNKGKSKTAKPKACFVCQELATTSIPTFKGRVDICPKCLELLNKAPCKRSFKTQAEISKSSMSKSELEAMILKQKGGE